MVARPWVLVLGVGLSPFVVPGAARVAATVVAAMGFEAQCATAERIFVGSVRSVESRRRAAAPAYFETAVTFAVEDAIAGGVPAEVTLTFAGGRIGDLEQVVDGMPRVVVGERYVVLAEPDDDPPLVSPVVGFNQGLYRVVADEHGRAVVRDREGRPLAGDVAATARMPEPLATRARAGEVDLGAFVDAIKAARGR